MIEPDEISDDRDRGLVVLAYARTVAPCLDNLEPDSMLREQAVAILKGVVAELPAAGSRRVTGQSRNGTSVSFAAAGAAFTKDDRAALRALCGPSPAAAATPVGSFPKSGLVSEVWPERS